MSDKPRCDTCRFFKLWRNETVCGVCLAHPPTVHTSEQHHDGYFTAWPEVKTENWCGEYQPNLTNDVNSISEER